MVSKGDDSSVISAAKRGHIAGQNVLQGYKRFRLTHSSKLVQESLEKRRCLFRIVTVGAWLATAYIGTSQNRTFQVSFAVNIEK